MPKGFLSSPKAQIPDEDPCWLQLPLSQSSQDLDLDSILVHLFLYHQPLTE